MREKGSLQWSMQFSAGASGASIAESFPGVPSAAALTYAYYLLILDCNGDRDRGRCYYSAALPGSDWLCSTG